MKICKLCGEDCSQRPRVKDAAGSYYCKTCHGAAMEQRENREAAALGLADAGFNDAGGDDEYGVLSEILAGAPAAPPPGRQCAGCGAGVAADAHVCTNCGMNLDSGQQMQVHVMKAASSSSGQLWPIIVGIISIVVGVIDSGMRIMNIVIAIQEEDYSGARGWLHLVLSLVLIYGGAKLIMKRQSAVSLLKQWATVKLVLGFTCFGIAFAGIAASQSTADRIAEVEGIEGFELDQSTMLFVFAISFVWYIAWAAFLAVWLRRAKIETDAGQW